MSHTAIERASPASLAPAIASVDELRAPALFDDHQPSEADSITAAAALNTDADTLSISKLYAS
jgi:hypothetical protein